jgi:hypothetical protein
MLHQYDPLAAHLSIRRELPIACARGLVLIKQPSHSTSAGDCYLDDQDPMPLRRRPKTLGLLPRNMPHNDAAFGLLARQGARAFLQAYLCARRVDRRRHISASSIVWQPLLGRHWAGRGALRAGPFLECRSPTRGLLAAQPVSKSTWTPR